jgi:hypothetical protein
LRRAATTDAASYAGPPCHAAASCAIQACEPIHNLAIRNFINFSIDAKRTNIHRQQGLVKKWNALSSNDLQAKMGRQAKDGTLSALEKTCPRHVAWATRPHG